MGINTIYPVLVFMYSIMRFRLRFSLSLLRFPLLSDDFRFSEANRSNIHVDDQIQRS